MLVRSTLLLLTLLPILFSTTLLANDLFEFHGYLRSGFGVNKNGSPQQNQQLPSVNKYRLGNENETYGELKFTQNWDKEKTTRTHILLAYVTGQNANFDSANDQFTIREAYGEMNHAFVSWPLVNFWAGQRFYGREDIHINDYYFLDRSGYGGGVEKIDLSFADLSMAYIGTKEPKSTEANPPKRAVKNTLDLQLDLHPELPLLGQASLWLAGSSLSGNDKSKGVGAGIIFKKKFSTIEQKMALLYGVGSLSNLSTALPLDNKLYLAKGKGAYQTLALNSYSGDISDAVSFQSLLLYRQDNMNSWVSAGIRPVTHLVSKLYLATELGGDLVIKRKNDAPYGRGNLIKFTVAPELKPDSSFFSRPSLRVYATTSLQNKKVDEDFGIQVESWW